MLHDAHASSAAAPHYYQQEAQNSRHGVHALSATEDPVHEFPILVSGDEDGRRREGSDQRTWSSPGIHSTVGGIGQQWAVMRTSSRSRTSKALSIHIALFYSVPLFTVSGASALPWSAAPQSPPPITAPTTAARTSRKRRGVEKRIAVVGVAAS